MAGRSEVRGLRFVGEACLSGGRFSQLAGSACAWAGFAFCFALAWGCVGLRSGMSWGSFQWVLLGGYGRLPGWGPMGKDGVLRREGRVRTWPEKVLPSLLSQVWFSTSHCSHDRNVLALLPPSPSIGFCFFRDTCVLTCLCFLSGSFARDSAMPPKWRRDEVPVETYDDFDFEEGPGPLKECCAPVSIERVAVPHKGHISLSKFWKDNAQEVVHHDTLERITLDPSGSWELVFDDDAFAAAADTTGRLEPVLLEDSFSKKCLKAEVKSSSSSTNLVVRTCNGRSPAGEPLSRSCTFRFR